MSENKMTDNRDSDKIKFQDSETGEEVEFQVVEQTRVNNINYLLVTEGEDEETAYILKDLSELKVRRHLNHSELRSEWIPSCGDE